jgi:hypothetical protein
MLPDHLRSFRHRSAWLAVGGAVLFLVLGLAGGCGDDDEESGPTEFEFTLTGLEPLPVGHWYEAWARFPDQSAAAGGLSVEHGDEIPVSLGAFQVNEEGGLESLEGGPVTFELPEGHDPNPINVVITVRDTAEPDTTIGPILIGGDVLGDDNQGHATLTTDYHDAIVGDIRSATGSCIMATPSDGDNTNETQGIWFATPAGLPALTLPVLGEGWHYDAYVILGTKEISIGHFATADVEDSDGKGPEAGPQPGFTTPGSDFLTSAPNFSLGGVSVLIALLPEHGDDHEGLAQAPHGAMFPYHVLEAEIPIGTLPRTPIALTAATEPLPAGSVTFQR